MNSKIQSAVVAGVLLGVALVVIAVVSSLSPVLGILGCCACLLPIGAGVFAVNKYVGTSPAPVELADGAVLGAIAGAVGGLIYLVIGAPLSYFINAAALQAQMEQLSRAGINLPFVGFGLVIVSGIIGVIVDVILATIGGLIGVAIFEKRKGGVGAPPPPPPPAPGGFGGGPAGGGGGSFGQGS
jgi:hypothetical protein